MYKAVTKGKNLDKKDPKIISFPKKLLNRSILIRLPMIILFWQKKLLF
jgi:hypothetical protein